MLKLKKIHILGFKSFCDRTEMTVAGDGYCRGGGAERVRQVEHSGRSELGAGRAERQDPARRSMADVIFAGTRDRKPLGMAEVTITMVDPEAYEGPMPVEPEVVVDHDGPADWDEDGCVGRRRRRRKRSLRRSSRGRLWTMRRAAESAVRRKVRKRGRHPGERVARSRWC